MRLEHELLGALAQHIHTEVGKINLIGIAVEKRWKTRVVIRDERWLGFIVNRTLRADFCGDQMGRCTSDVIRLRSLAHNGWNFELSLPRVGLVIVNLRIGEFNRDISQCRVKHLVNDFSEN